MYLEQENDTRGYVEGKGWAHSIAHGADLLASCVLHPNFETAMFPECLETVQNCLFKEATYIDDEDERLIFVIEALIERNIEESDLETWVLNIVNRLAAIFENEGFSLNYFRKKVNTVNFLKSLYFRLLYKNTSSKVRDLIENKLKELHLQLYGSKVLS
jgi:hypothetical protein